MYISAEHRPPHVSVGFTFGSVEGLVQQCCHHCPSASPLEEGFSTHLPLTKLTKKGRQEGRKGIREGKALNMISLAFSRLPEPSKGKSLKHLKHLRPKKHKLSQTSQFSFKDHSCCTKRFQLPKHNHIDRDQKSQHFKNKLKKKRMNMQTSCHFLHESARPWPAHVCARRRP